MNEVIKRTSSTEVDAFAEMLSSGVANARASMPMLGGGKPLLRLLKSGMWVFGVADDPVQEGSDWAINPRSIGHGWSCWSDNPGNQKNELLGDLVVPVTEKFPIEPEPVRGNAWKPQRVLDLKCLTGEDEGVEVTYKASSQGGMQAIDNLFAAIQKKYSTRPVLWPVPVVQLGVSDYQHVKYGQIFKPVLDVVDWADMDVTAREKGQVAAPAPEEVKPQAAKPPLGDGAPRRQRPVGRA